MVVRVLLLPVFATGLTAQFVKPVGDASGVGHGLEGRRERVRRALARSAPLPVVDRPDPADGAEDGATGPHWKTRTLVARAAGRPFVWAAVHRPRRALHRADHRRGLTDADFAVVEGWLGVSRLGG